MKKNILSLIFLFSILSFGANAQTITALDCNPQIGEIIEFSGPGYREPLTAGPAGLNQEWYFPNLSIGTLQRDSVLPSIYDQGASVYPNANTLRTNGLNRKFFKIDSASVEYYGSYVGLPTGNLRINFSNPKTRVRYPIIYGDTYSDQSSAFSVNSYYGYTITINSTINFTVDATGILHAPGGTFTNTIRVHSHAKEVATFAGFTNTIAIVSDTYDWYGAGFHEPLLSITSETFGANAPEVRLTCLYGEGNTLGVKSPFLNETDFKLFPNPATSADFVTLIYGEEIDTSTLNIVNIVGQPKSFTSFTESDRVKVNISDLPTGVYFVTIKKKDGRFLQKKLLIEKS